MTQLTRRSLLRAAAAYPALFQIGRAAKPTDIRIEDVRYSYEDYIYRTPIKFGGSVLDRATIINVNCTVRTVMLRSTRKSYPWVHLPITGCASSLLTQQHPAPLDPL